MVYYQNTWVNFIDHDQTQPALQRNYPEWHKNRDRYFVWVIELVDDKTNGMIDHYKQLLGDYLVSPYQRQPHITLYVSGFLSEKIQYNDDISSNDLLQQVNRIEGLGLEPFVLHIGHVNSFASAPFLEVVDHDGVLDRIRATLYALRYEVRTSHYIPHVTLGIYRDHFSTAHIASLMEQIEPLDVAITIDRLKLMSYSSADIGSSLRLEHELTLSR